MMVFKLSKTHFTLYIINNRQKKTNTEDLKALGTYTLGAVRDLTQCPSIHGTMPIYWYARASAACVFAFACACLCVCARANAV
jgi:hypothetical protein